MNEREIFDAALDIADSEERAAWLDQACGENANLRRHIDELLAAQSKLGSFLNQQPQNLNGTCDYEPVTEKSGSIIGDRYKLLQQIGEGGMGTVFMAEQTVPVQRKVALKIIKPGMDSKQVVARFEAERQALAMMDHINIAKVLDAGTTESGRPYFVMELVHGVPIHEFCDTNQLTPRERLELFIPVCQAIQHAHQKGIIHRDIKPSNVLVTMYDDKPVPKVIDFGVAKAIEQKLTQKTLFTQYGMMVGTFEYVSPEQAEMNAFGVDTRSDVYSLGVLLYELLTGTTPLERRRLREAAFGEIIRLIKEEEPPRPSVRLSTSETLAKVAAARKMEPEKLSSMVRGELDWIVMRCLEKDRSRRYDGASALAKDIQRYLADEPVEACSPTLGYRLRKVYRRNRAVILTAASFVVVLLVATGVSLTFAVLAKQSEKRASTNETIAKERLASLEVERQKLSELNYARTIQVAYQSWLDDSLTQTVKLIEDADPKYRGWEWHYLNRLGHQELFELKMDVGNGDGMQAKYSRDGSRIVTRRYSALGKANPDGEGTVIVWNARTGEETHRFSRGFSARSPDFHPNGTSLLVVHDRKSPESGEVVSEVVVWDLNTGKWKKIPLKEHANPIRTAKYSPDGSKIVTLCNDTASVWDTETGEVLSTLKGNKAQLISVMFDPRDERRILSVRLTDKSSLVWDAETGKILEEWQPEKLLLRTMYSPDGRMIITTSIERPARVWDAGKHVEIVKLDDRSRWATDASISPDGQRIVTTSLDGVVKVWDAKTGKLLRVIKGHLSGRTYVEFNHDGTRILTSSSSGSVKVWDATADSEPTMLPLQERPLLVDFNRDGSRFATGARSGVVQVWDTASRTLIRTIVHEEPKRPGKSSGERVHNSRLVSLELSDDGQRLITFRWDFDGISKTAATDLSVWDVATGKRFPRIKLEAEEMCRDASFSPEGESIVTRNRDERTLRIWNIKTGELIRTLKGHPDEQASTSLTHDGKRYVTSGEDHRTLQIRDTTTGEELVRIQGQPGEHFVDYGGTYFSPDGKRFVLRGYRKVFAGYVGGETFIRDGETGEKVVRLRGIKTGRFLTFSPDGRRVVTANPFGLTIWDATTGHDLLKIRCSSASQRHWARFTPDGHRLITINGDGRFMVLDGTPLPKTKK